MDEFVIVIYLLVVDVPEQLLCKYGVAECVYDHHIAFKFPYLAVAVVGR